MIPPRVALAWTLAAWLVVVVSAITSVVFLPIDETRYVGVALEMWQRGDLLVPHINGELYAHKPPLLFWLMQLGWAIYGLNAWWPRLSVAVFALGAVGLTWWLGRALWPARRDVAVLAPVMLVGSLYWAVRMPAVMFDSVLAFWVLLAMVGVVAAACRRPSVGWTLVAIGLGLGVLTKGPVVLLLVVPAALLAFVWHPQLPPLRQWYGGLTAAVLGGALIALAWAVPASMRGGPEYGKAIFWGQTAGRVVESFAHRRPVWWYLPQLLIILFPWAVWPAAWRALWRLRLVPDWGVRFVLCWLLPALVVFSLASGKQAHYLLPLVPGYALLLARAMELATPAGSREWMTRVPVALVPLGLAIASLWLPTHYSRFNLPDWVALIPSWMPLMFLVAAIVALYPYRRVSTVVVALASATVLLVAAAAVGIMRPATPWHDVAPAATVIARAQAEGTPVVHQGNSHNRFRFAGRLAVPLPELRGEELSQWACHHPDGLIVTYARARPAKVVPSVYEQPLRGRWLRIVRAKDYQAQTCEGRRRVVAPGGQLLLQK